ncbi:hypothetical protein [Paracoccus sp. PAR01]|nr:hypothetical protein [Paracoccus sp. PAR01]
MDAPDSCMTRRDRRKIAEASQPENPLRRWYFVPHARMSGP